MHFEIKDGQVVLHILWSYYRPLDSDFVELVIEADDAQWVNQPDMALDALLNLSLLLECLSNAEIQGVERSSIENSLCVVIEGTVSSLERSLPDGVRTSADGTFFGSLQLLWIQRTLCEGSEVPYDQLLQLDPSAQIVNVALNEHWLDLGVLEKLGTDAETVKHYKLLVGAASWRDQVGT